MVSWSLFADQPHFADHADHADHWSVGHFADQTHFADQWSSVYHFPLTTGQHVTFCWSNVRDSYLAVYLVQGIQRTDETKRQEVDKM